MSKRLKKLKDASSVVRPNNGRSIPQNAASSNMFVRNVTSLSYHKIFTLLVNDVYFKGLYKKRCLADPKTLPHLKWSPF